MSELTDLEICKKIAEIEGLNQVEIKGKVFVSHGFMCDNLYSPLTDDALCFKLMVKHDVTYSAWGKNHRASCLFDKEYGEYEVDILNSSPNKAICLAIIESNKGK